MDRRRCKDNGHEIQRIDGDKRLHCLNCVELFVQINDVIYKLSDLEAKRPKKGKR